MADSIGKLQETSPSNPLISAQGTAIEGAMTRLKICPKKVLGSLGHLRIEKARIKPLENESPKAGGNADVQAAILVPAQSSNSPELEDPEYIAVKKLRLDTDTEDDRALAPFAHEVNLLHGLSHPSVVKVVGFVEDLEKGIAWMIFSWEKNGNLREFVRSANWELPERISLINDVASGVGYLHGRTPPICHGDLKSLNILVNSENRAIITDFGSARTMDSAAVRSAGAAAVIQFLPTAESLKAEVAASGDFITMTGPAWTIRWAAPELLEGEFPCLASDIWALGWIFWEAITGNFPFDEENDLAIVLRITRGDLPVVGDHGQLKQVKALCSLMGECWRLDVNERPTAIKCQQVLSFMNQAIPSNSKARGGSAATRSSGLLCALGWIQLGNGMMSKAKTFFQESLSVAESVGDNHGRAGALDALGCTYRMQSEYSEAEESYIQARDTYSQIGNQLGFANSVKGLGDVYQMRSEYSKAGESYIQARNTYSQIGNQHGFANSVKGLGDVYQMRSEYSEAEESYIQALNTYSQIGNQLGFANSVRGLAEVYRMRSEYSKAEESYIQARDIYSQIGDQLGFANSVWGLGDVYQMRREYPKAEEFYIQASNTYSQIGNQLGFANSVKGLGDVYQMSSEYSAAEESYLEAESVYRRIGYMKGLADNIWSLGGLRRRQAQYKEAERLVCEASAIYGKFGLKVDVMRCYRFLREVRHLMAA